MVRYSCWLSWVLGFIGLHVGDSNGGKGGLVDRDAVVVRIELHELKLGERMVVRHKLAVDAVHEARGHITGCELGHVAKPLAGLIDGKFEELLGEFGVGHGLILIWKWRRML